MSGHHPIVQPSTYRVVLVILAVLMTLTVVAAKVPALEYSPAVNLIVALAIAFTKMAFIMLIFMHLKYSSKVVKVFGTAGLFWMMIFFTLTFADFASHGWHTVFVQPPQ